MMRVGGTSVTKKLVTAASAAVTAATTSAALDGAENRAEEPGSSYDDLNGVLKEMTDWNGTEAEGTSKTLWVASKGEDDVNQANEEDGSHELPPDHPSRTSLTNAITYCEDRIRRLLEAGAGGRSIGNGDTHSSNAFDASVYHRLGMKLARQEVGPTLRLAKQFATNESIQQGMMEEIQKIEEESLDEENQSLGDSQWR